MLRMKLARRCRNAPPIQRRVFLFAAVIVTSTSTLYYYSITKIIHVNYAFKCVHVNKDPMNENDDLIHNRLHHNRFDDVLNPPANRFDDFNNPRTKRFDDVLYPLTNRFDDVLNPPVNRFVDVLNKSTNVAVFMSRCRKEDVWRLAEERRLDTTTTKGGLTFRRYHSVGRTCQRGHHCTNLTLPRTALLSYPQSGSSWVRHLVEHLTGLPTGSFYSYTEFVRNGIVPNADAPFKCEHQMRGVVLIRDPWPSLEERRSRSIFDKSYDRIVLLIRNPFRSILSFYKSKLLDAKALGDVDFDVQSESWDEFIKQNTPLWAHFTTMAVKSSLPKLIIYHEELAANSFYELLRIAHFLHADERITDFSFCCVLKDFAARKKDNKHDAPYFYSAQQREFVNGCIDMVAWSLRAEPDVAEYISKYKMSS